PDVAVARVDVTVERDASALPAGSVHAPEFDLYLEHRDSGVVIQARSGLTGRGPHRFRAPPGSYRLVAEGTPTVDSYHGQLFQGRAFGRAERLVELSLAAPSAATLWLSPGGYLRLNIEGSTVPEDRAAVLAEEPIYGRTELSDALTQAARGVRLTLVGPESAQEPIYRAVQMMGYPSLTSSWDLGTTGTSEMLPQGRYQLVGRTRSGRVAKVSVVIEPGTTTEATLSFSD
ncbi:MAG: hypothetical protein AAGG01_23230, partial [Planctomycetota bacterium]